jgi:hypothetical protein
MSTGSASATANTAFISPVSTSEITVNPQVGRGRISGAVSLERVAMNSSLAAARRMAISQSTFKRRQIRRGSLSPTLTSLQIDKYLIQQNRFSV